LRGGGVGADHHDRELPRPGIGAQLAEDFVSLNIRQVEVEQDEIGQMLACKFEADAALHRGDQFYLRPPREDALDEAKIGKIVLDGEQGAGSDGARQFRDARNAGAELARGRGGRPLDERQFHSKGRSLAGHTFDADPPAHRFDEVLGQRQPEARAFDDGVADVEALEGHE